MTTTTSRPDTFYFRLCLASARTCGMGGAGVHVVRCRVKEPSIEKQSTVTVKSQGVKIRTYTVGYAEATY